MTLNTATRKDERILSKLRLAALLIRGVIIDSPLANERILPACPSRVHTLHIKQIIMSQRIQKTSGTREAKREKIGEIFSLTAIANCLF